jgi:hypothetical protein
MTPRDIKAVLGSNTYPGRGILLGRSEAGARAVLVYFIMAAAKTAATAFLSKRTTASAPRPSTRRK